MARFTSLIVGENSLVIQCAEILRAAGGGIVAIASRSPTVKDWAVRHEIALIDPGGNLETTLAAFDYDWLFSIANLRIVPPGAVKRARCGAVNFHDGPLPELAGLNTPSWSLLEGRPVHGVSWHEITEGIDEGDVLARQDFAIDPGETVLTLNTKCYEAGIASFGELVRDIAEGTVRRSPQDLAGRTYCARDRRPEAAGTLRFDRPAEDLSRLVRALSFGEGYANPLTSAKILTERGPCLVNALTVLDAAGSGRPGEILEIRGTGVVIATLDSPVLAEATARGADGDVPLASILRPGDRLPILDEDGRASLDSALARVAPHENVFRARLARCEDAGLDGIAPPDAALAAREPRNLPLDFAAGRTAEERTGLLLAYLGRIATRPSFDIAYASDELDGFRRAHPGYFSGSVPIRIEAGSERIAADVLADAAASIEDARRRLTFPLDLFDRTPGLGRPDLFVGVRLTGQEDEAQPIAGCALTFVIGANGDHLLYDGTRVSERKAGDLVERLAIFAAAFDPPALLGSLPVMSEAEREHVVHAMNRTERTYDRTACVHQLLGRQAALTPDAVAVSFAGTSITYRELEERAERIARRLASEGAGPDVIIGLHLPRGIDLVVGAYAILKAGAAYLPLDPAFPANRLALMVEDSATPLVLTNRELSGTFRETGAAILAIEDVYAAPPAPDALRQATPENLAYVIYTSGSTGRPKGVMVEHRNVANFFAGMDDRIPRAGDGRDVWLAVTSLSFDISVLEIFWTLARGFKVVVHSTELERAKAGRQRRVSIEKPIDFSLFYWGNDDGAGSGKYRTLLEGARFADTHDFQAIWTPERHFHAFGGPYPNPSVTGAAVAAVTKNLAVRAGSCVLPLHHPARVAEEWAVVDNLSDGRVGLAFASGWMPEDFVLRPENAPPHNKAAMLRDIETVRRLWRGEAVEFDFGAGKASVVTQPRPVSRELPVWVTTAGNPDTYRDAARLGANVLTHLLGQSIPELAEKIRIYRETLAEAGHDPAGFKVTLMLHTLVGEDREEVRALAREPMKDYLRSAAALIKQYAWAFPAFKKPAGVTNPMEVDLQSLDAEEMDAILEFAFTRYFEDSGLFGTVDDAMARVEQLAAIGVDEVACLIDFGLPSQTVLDALVPLAQVVAQARSPAPAENEDRGLAADIRREGATHLQCTPSMATMFLGDPQDRAAIADLRHIFIGGEALRRSLVEELRAAGPATIENMYGPTETTIWSSTVGAGDNSEDVVPLGSPIANTQLYILDRFQQPVPAGTPGELFIGGEGVTRGYLNRDELTRERFLANPFAPGRIYRTGDVVRLSASGSIEFMGRVDNQVKIRGNRLELGEIEARIAEHPGVQDVVVTVREDRPGDKRIVAYLRAPRSIALDPLKARLAAELPEYMVPAHIVVLDAFPLTPNAKVDRSRLPRPEEPAAAALAEEAAPAEGVERTVAEAFKRTLGLAQVRRTDNFFALGGHSLLAVQMHRELKATVAPALTITDLFRFPTVAGLAEHIAGRTDTGRQLDKIAERAAARRSAMEGRRASFARAANGT